MLSLCLDTVVEAQIQMWVFSITDLNLAWKGNWIPHIRLLCCLLTHVHCMYLCATTLFFFLSSTSRNVQQVQRASASITFLNKAPRLYNWDCQKPSVFITPQQSVHVLWFPSHGGNGQNQQKITGFLLHYPPWVMQSKTTLFMWFVLTTVSCVRSLESLLSLLDLPWLTSRMWGDFQTLPRPHCLHT